MSWLDAATDESEPPPDDMSSAWLDSYGPYLKAGLLALVPVASYFLSHALVVVPVTINAAGPPKKRPPKEPLYSRLKRRPPLQPETSPASLPVPTFPVIFAMAELNPPQG